jgi:hypothetical protein
MAETDTSNGKNTWRDYLAIAIVIFSIGLLITIAWVSIITIRGAGGTFDQTNSSLQGLYSTFLPLIGTWMGAVIAFYFGKENFEAANKSVQAIVQKFVTSEDKLKSIKVSDPNVMIAIGNITDNKAIRTKPDNEIMIESDLLGFFETNKNIDRLPIMDDKFVIRYILHKSLITDFALAFQRDKIKVGELVAATDLPNVKLVDLINSSNEDYKLSVTKSAEYVSKDASLLEAQTKINGSRYCQDVFVTADGSATSPVIGWITNNKLNELGKV